MESAPRSPGPRTAVVAAMLAAGALIAQQVAGRATRDALNARGFSSELTEIKGHTHWYYDRAPDINRSAWDFLKKYELVGDPNYEKYQFGR